MKIISYNVNGIRAAIKKGFLTWLEAASPDVICIQETKANKEQLNSMDFELAGYPYQYWLSAEKKGYSGVVIFCKKEPNHIEYGTGIDSMDSEGRNIRVDFDEISVMSMYLPSGSNIERLDYKFDYMDAILNYLTDLRKEIPNLVVCGDYNICHNEIDIHNPKIKTSGFLPKEREWLGKFIDSGFIDSFRHLHPESQEYSWWSYRANARNNNKGWRLDYNMVTSTLEKKIDKAYILPAAKHSDHCPIVVELKF